MDEEIKGRLTSYLETLEQATSTASEFVVAEAPAIAQEYLAWVFWGNVAYLVIGVLVMVLLVKLAIAGSREWDKDILDLNMPMATVGAFSGMGIVAFSLWMLQCGSMLLKVSISPRLVLLEKIAELVN